jgi:DNA polymerase-3 subunit alpha
MSLKDIARIKGLSPSEAESLSKLVPADMTLVEAYDSNKKFRLNVDSSDKFTEVFESAKLIEGLPRQHSTHAAGIVLSSNDI